MKKTLLGCALALALTTTSCLGPNNALNNINQWNRTVTDSKWTNELIFIPASFVHMLFYMGDVIIFNSIEFWGGSNPIEPNSKM